MEEWNVELLVMRNLSIRRGISQRESFSPLPFTLAIILLTVVLRKVKDEYEFGSERLPICCLLMI